MGAKTLQKLTRQSERACCGKHKQNTNFNSVEQKWMKIECRNVAWNQSSLQLLLHLGKYFTQILKVNEKFPPLCYIIACSPCPSETRKEIIIQTPFLPGTEEKCRHPSVQAWQFQSFFVFIYYSNAFYNILQIPSINLKNMLLTFLSERYHHCSVHRCTTVLLTQPYRKQSAAQQLQQQCGHVQQCMWIFPLKLGISFHGALFYYFLTHFETSLFASKDYKSWCMRTPVR